MTISAQSLAKALKARPSGKGWIAHCPAHKDDTASLSVNVGPDNMALYRCHAGCSQEKVTLRLKELGITSNPNMEEPKPFHHVESYFYTDGNHNEVLRVDRFENEDGKKTFKQFHKNNEGQWTPGKSPTATIAPYAFESWKDSDFVFLVEGEKARNHLNQILPNKTTCIAGGASAWRDDYAKWFTGKRVYILPDNDDPGRKFAHMAASTIHRVAKETKIVTLPGLPEKGDAVEWIEMGGTAKALSELCQAQAAFEDRTGWQRPSTTKEDIIKQRHRNRDKLIDFGIEYLNLAVDGIAPNDLILIGAKTGAGKTELVTSLAMNACSKGHRVHHFALEAEFNEIKMRGLYKLLAHAYYTDERFHYMSQYRSPKTQPNFRRWMMGHFDDWASEVYDEIIATYENQMRNYRVMYKPPGRFTAKDLCDEITKIKNESDLIIIDHFHFLDFEGANENQEMTKATHLIRDLSIQIGIPIILVAHVRKTERKGAALLPEIEDFQGTSNLAKICTKAIMLGPAPIPPTDSRKFPTLIRVLKNRFDGSVVRYVALHHFDISKNAYDNEFEVGFFESFATKFVPFSEPHSLPAWLQDSQHVKLVSHEQTEILSLERSGKSKVSNRKPK